MHYWSAYVFICVTLIRNSFWPENIFARFNLTLPDPTFFQLKGDPIWSDPNFAPWSTKHTHDLGIYVCMYVCMGFMALIIALLLCAMSQDSLLSVSVRRLHFVFSNAGFKGGGKPCPTTPGTAALRRVIQKPLRTSTRVKLRHSIIGSSGFQVGNRHLWRIFSHSKLLLSNFDVMKGVSSA